MSKKDLSNVPLHFAAYSSYYSSLLGQQTTVPSPDAGFRATEPSGEAPSRPLQAQPSQGRPTRPHVQSSQARSGQSQAQPSQARPQQSHVQPSQAQPQQTAAQISHRSSQQYVRPAARPQLLSQRPSGQALAQASQADTDPVPHAQAYRLMDSTPQYDTTGYVAGAYGPFYGDIEAQTWGYLNEEIRYRREDIDTHVERKRSGRPYTSLKEPPKPFIDHLRYFPDLAARHEEGEEIRRRLLLRPGPLSSPTPRLTAPKCVNTVPTPSGTGLNSGSLTTRKSANTVPTPFGTGPSSGSLTASNRANTRPPPSGTGLDSGSFAAAAAALPPLSPDPEVQDSLPPDEEEGWTTVNRADEVNKHASLPQSEERPVPSRALARQENHARKPQIPFPPTHAIVEDYSDYRALPPSIRPPSALVYDCGVNRSGRLDCRVYGAPPEMDLNLCAYVFADEVFDIDCPHGRKCFWRHWIVDIDGKESWVDEEWWRRVSKRTTGFKGYKADPRNAFSDYDGLPRILRNGDVVVGPCWVVAKGLERVLVALQLRHSGRTDYDKVPELTASQQQVIVLQSSPSLLRPQNLG